MIKIGITVYSLMLVEVNITVCTIRTNDLKGIIEPKNFVTASF